MQCLPGAAALGALCCALGLLFVLSVRPAVSDLAALRSVTDRRARYLAQQRALGCTDVTVPVASAPATRFSPLWGDALSDLMQDPNNERNRALALYYGVPVVRGDPDLEADGLASTPLSLRASPTARRTKIPAWGLQFQPVSCIIIFTAGP